MKTFEVPVWWLEQSRGTMTVEVDDDMSAEEARQQAQRQMSESADLADLVDGEARAETVDFGADEPRLIEEGQQ